MELSGWPHSASRRSRLSSTKEIEEITAIFLFELIDPSFEIVESMLYVGVRILDELRPRCLPEPLRPRLFRIEIVLNSFEEFLVEAESYMGHCVTP